MKKNVLMLLLAGFTFAIQAQEKINYTKVVTVQDESKEILFSRAMEWIAKTFKNPESVIKLKDPVNGKIIINAVIPYTPSKFSFGGTDGAIGSIDFVLNLYFKDGRFKYEITDFIHAPYQSEKNFGLLTTSQLPPFKSYLGMKKRAVFLWEDLKMNAKNTGSVLSVSLETELNKKSESENDNW